MNKIVFNKRDVLKYVGDVSQLFGIKDYQLKGGKAEGVRALDVKNGAGLEFTVLPDRGLDIAWLSYKNNNFSYISQTGVVSPEYHDKDGYEFWRSFYVGFLTTCGLTYAGLPSVDNGVELGIHGRINNTPGEEIYAGIEWTDGAAIMKIKGLVREAKFHGENIVLEREITCRYGENRIYINDTVENNGFREEPLMIIYHFNLGYPLLDEKSYYFTPAKKVTPRNAVAAKDIDKYDKSQLPTPGFMEQAFFHDLKTDDTGMTLGALINPELQLGVAIRFNKNQLGRFTQWRCLDEGEYVMGIEPCNCIVEGRATARQEGSLEFIKPGEIRRFNLQIEILDGMDRIRQIEDMTKNYS